MKRELYTWEQVMAYSIIALHNYLNSGNRDNLNLNTLKMFLEPLPKIYDKMEVVNYSIKLLKQEEESKNIKTI